MKSRTWIWTTIGYLFATLVLAAIAIPSAQAQTYKVIYDFTGGQDGGQPVAGLTIDGAGNLYGTTQLCTTSCFGTVFKLKPSGPNWIFTPLYDFKNSGDGDSPHARVIIGPNGSLYGTTAQGGKFSFGVVFNLKPPAGFCRTVSCTWTESVLYNFTGGSDGYLPLGDLVFDRAGNIYGTTLGGGSSNNGTIFKLDSLGNETVLHSFSGFPDGDAPVAGLIKDDARNLYGTTRFGGNNIQCPPLGSGGCGTVFKLDTLGTLTEVHSFSTPPDGGYPEGNLLLDNAGNIYGTTAQGGTGNCYTMVGHQRVNIGCGTVFKVDTNGNESVLHSFLGGSDGENPQAALVLDSAGTLYGTTVYGGSGNNGTVFKLDSLGNETVPHSFSGGLDGGEPIGPLVFDADGNLYGTTLGGGTGSSCFLGCGVVFEITP